MSLFWFSFPEFGVFTILLLFLKRYSSSKTGASKKTVADSDSSSDSSEDEGSDSSEDSDDGLH